MAGESLLLKILGLSFFGWLIWIFLSAGIGTAFSFSSVPMIAWAVLIIIFLAFIFRKKQ